LCRRGSSNGGFTLIEIIVAVAIMSVMMMLIGPRVAGFLAGDREQFTLLTGTITRTFDEAFLTNKVHYLCLHLFSVAKESADSENPLFGRTNGISVASIEGDTFVENTRKMFRYRSFPDSFRLEKVLLSTGEEIAEGTVLVPFYPQGYSSDVIIHLLVDDDKRYSVRINKHLKEPLVSEEYAGFDE
jgi:prepilin-type N-terminal cleavage/methylation domain-containing protein